MRFLPYILRVREVTLKGDQESKDKRLDCRETNKGISHNQLLAEAGDTADKQGCRSHGKSNGEDPQNLHNVDGEEEILLRSR